MDGYARKQMNDGSGWSLDTILAAKKRDTDVGFTKVTGSKDGIGWSDDNRG